MSFYPVSGNTIRTQKYISQKITHYDETKHSTQSYTNDKGYNTKQIKALMSAPPQAIAPNPHTNLLNAYLCAL
jgi:hypothetical protein